MEAEVCSKVRDFIADLDAAVEIDCVNGRCEKVKDLLETIFHDGEDLIPDCFTRPCAEKYARHLLHRDPDGRYSVVIMVWDVGQGTYLHDHAGEWCVECVYRGKIKVTSYDLLGSEDDPVLNFEEQQTVFAGMGEAGALIPPFEYHTISNALTDAPSVTVHVYGHELTWCNIFVPTEGGWERVRRELSYTE